jgi:molybdopterin synthase catalytic subunit
VLPLVGGSEDGAIDLFLGVVRDHNEGSAVSGMHYDAYVEMAEPTLQAIVTEANALPGVGRVAAVHRIGELAVGDVSVAIAASAPHRAAAFSASRYVIEEIKKRLPVWKQERYLTGELKWLGGEREQNAR